jgi:DNA repair exonuclease SbcCD ATPase subunit
MIADINKYKKLDKELTSLRQKHTELENNFNSKITEITDQRDALQSEYDQLKEKVQQYEQLQIKYDQLVQNPTNDIAHKINDLKTENDQLRQSNWKHMEELNKQQQNQTSSSS